MKHGLSKSRLYHIYNGMKQRCYDKGYKPYKNYGERGIRIADEWLGENGFLNFYKWSIANGYEEHLTIDRIDNNKGYSPENCRWTDRKTQQRNRNVTIMVEYKGKTIPLAEAAEKENIPYQRLHDRVKRGNK